MKTRPLAMALLWVMAGPGDTPAQAEGPSIDPSKKIILMAGGHRRPDTLLRDLERMERLGAFDGIAVYPPLALHGARKDVIGRLFRTERHDIEDFGQAIADLQAVHAKATRFKHNFLLAYLTTGVFAIDPPDWFDPEFDAVVHNWKVAAEFCKRSGLMGIMFDDEVYYGADLWTYRGIGLKYHDTKSAKEYADQAFLRGAQIMRAINEVFPDIKILSLHGPAEGHGDRLGDFDSTYGLMRAFFDGLLSESTGRAQIIDGYERAYGFRVASEYAAARRLMKEEMRGISRVPAKYERHFRVAFPFYIGGYRQYGFDGDYENVDGLLRGEAEGYYYTPEEFEYSLHQALRHTDEYVWLYTDGRCKWWDREEDSIYIAQAYRDALERVRGRVPPLPKGRKLAAYAAPRETEAATTVESGPISESKKIIMFGSGRRNPRGFRQDVGWLEEMAAFDGMTLYPALHREDGTRSEAVGRLFRTERLRIEEMAIGIADVQAGQAGAKRFEDNFLLTYLTTGRKSILPPDWFDPEFDAVVHNWKVAADFVKRTDLAGILFSDSAWYGTNLWTYEGLKYEGTKTAREYADQAFERGAQIMRAINEVHPDLHIVFINGPAESRGATRRRRPFRAASGLRRRPALRVHGPGAHHRPDGPRLPLARLLRRRPPLRPADSPRPQPRSGRAVRQALPRRLCAHPRPADALRLLLHEHRPQLLHPGGVRVRPSPGPAAHRRVRVGLHRSMRLVGQGGPRGVHPPGLSGRPARRPPAPSRSAGLAKPRPPYRVRAGEGRHRPQTHRHRFHAGRRDADAATTRLRAL